MIDDSLQWKRWISLLRRGVEGGNAMIKFISGIGSFRGSFCRNILSVSNVDASYYQDTCFARRIYTEENLFSFID